MNTPYTKPGDLLAMWLHDKWQNLYLHFHNICGHQQGSHQIALEGWWLKMRRIPPTKSQDLLTAWSLEKSKNISAISRHLWSSNLTRFWVRFSDSTHQVMWQFNHMVTWELKNLYLHMHTANDHQIWQGCDLGYNDVIHLIR